MGGHEALRGGLVRPQSRPFLPSSLSPLSALQRPSLSSVRGSLDSSASAPNSIIGDRAEQVLPRFGRTVATAGIDGRVSRVLRRCGRRERLGVQAPGVILSKQPSSFSCLLRGDRRNSRYIRNPSGFGVTRGVLVTPPPILVDTAQARLDANPLPVVTQRNSVEPNRRSGAKALAGARPASRNRDRTFPLPPRSQGARKVRAMPTSQLGDEDFLKLYARNRALGKIMHGTRFGEVDAISFDLRHSKINPDEWIMDHLGGDDGREPTRTETLPFIWFPWYGQFDPERLKAEVVKECRESNEYDRNRPPTLREVFGNVTDAEYRSYLKQERKPKPLGKKWVNEEIAKRTPDAIVKPGDCIRVHKVIMYIHDGRPVYPNTR
jgi:hypothetical protein